jgi:hypothetical protein
MACGELVLTAGTPPFATTLAIGGFVGLAGAVRGTWNNYLATEQNANGTVIQYMPAFREMYFWQFTASLDLFDYRILMGLWEWSKDIARSAVPRMTLEDWQSEFVDVYPRSREIAVDAPTALFFTVAGTVRTYYFAQFSVIFGREPKLISQGGDRYNVEIILVEDTEIVPTTGGAPGRGEVPGRGGDLIGGVPTGDPPKMILLDPIETISTAGRHTVNMRFYIDG